MLLQSLDEHVRAVSQDRKSVSTSTAPATCVCFLCHRPAVFQCREGERSQVMSTCVLVVWLVGWSVGPLVSQPLLWFWSVQHNNIHFTSASLKFFHKFYNNKGFKQNSKMNGIKWIKFCLPEIVLFIAGLFAMQWDDDGDAFSLVLSMSVKVVSMHLCINCRWHDSAILLYGNEIILATLYKVVYYEPQ